MRAIGSTYHVKRHVGLVEHALSFHLLVLSEDYLDGRSRVGTWTLPRSTLSSGVNDRRQHAQCILGHASNLKTSGPNYWCATAAVELKEFAANLRFSAKSQGTLAGVDVDRCPIFSCVAGRAIQHSRNVGPRYYIVRGGHSTNSPPCSWCARGCGGTRTHPGQVQSLSGSTSVKRQTPLSRVCCRCVDAMRPRQPGQFCDGLGPAGGGVGSPGPEPRPGYDNRCSHMHQVSASAMAEGHATSVGWEGGATPALAAPSRWHATERLEWFVTGAKTGRTKVCACALLVSAAHAVDFGNQVGLRWSRT